MIAAWLWLACGVETLEPVVVAAASPLLSVDRDIDRTPWQGTVNERLEAGGYTYLLVDEVWVVGMDKPVGVGDRVQISPIGRATAFHSSRLERTFERLDFSVITPR